MTAWVLFGLASPLVLAQCEGGASFSLHAEQIETERSNAERALVKVEIHNCTNHIVYLQNNVADSLGRQRFNLKLVAADGTLIPDRGIPGAQEKSDQPVARSGSLTLIPVPVGSTIERKISLRRAFSLPGPGVFTLYVARWDLESKNLIAAPPIKVTIN